MARRQPARPGNTGPSTGSTGSLTLAFGVRPGRGQAREAETRALENRLQRLDQIRQTRAARVAGARARLNARLGAWLRHPEAIAEALYRDAGERLKHGEVDVGTLIAGQPRTGGCARGGRADVRRGA